MHHDVLGVDERKSIKQLICTSLFTFNFLVHVKILPILKIQIIFCDKQRWLRGCVIHCRSFVGHDLQQTNSFAKETFFFITLLTLYGAKANRAFLESATFDKIKIFLK